MKKLIQLFSLSIFLGFSVPVNSQQIERQVIGSGGTTGTGGAMILDYNIGELVVATGQGGGNILTQGFEQADYIITGINPNHGSEPVDITVFPNPASDEINLRGTIPGAGKISLEMWDISGKLISKHAFTLNNGQVDEKIDLSGVATGQYHFSMYEGEMLRASFVVRKVK